jgi:hypothetical protein
MAGRIDFIQKEKEIALKAVKKLRGAVRQQIANSSTSRTGNELRLGNAGSRFKDGRLQRLTIKAPYYTFMRNYGFEGKKSNGINMRLKATEAIAKALESSSILDSLADEISEIRLDQVAALIQFKK